MENINKYKKHKFYQLLNLIIFSVLLYFFDKEVFSIAMIILYIISLIFSNTLLYEIKIVDDKYIFKTYSLLYKKVELIIKQKDFISIQYHTEKIFRDDALEISFRGEFTTIKREFYLNSSPWDEINQNIIYLKNIESKKTQILQQVN
jgi:hypothetical protein